MSGTGGAGYNSSAPYAGISPTPVNTGAYTAPMTARVSTTEAPAILPLGMLVSTTYHIEGFRIKEYKGIVRGVMVREPTIGQNFKAGFQGMLAVMSVLTCKCANRAASSLMTI